MQRTILLAITLLALLTRISWAQTPTAEPAAIPPAPPVATATDSQAIASESDNSAEIPPLLIEEPKADDPRVEEFQQIIQLLVNRNIAKVVPPAVPGKPTDSHPTITFTFVPTTNADAIRGVLIDLSLINISNLRVIIRDQSKFYEGAPPTEARILDYESFERQHVVALWKLFKQRKVNASFFSGKQNVSYGIPALPTPELGAETTEQIKVEVGKAYDASVALQEVLRKDGPPCSLGYDEITNTLLVDRRDGVSDEVKKSLNRWQKYYFPALKPPVASSTTKHAGQPTSKSSETTTEEELTEAESPELYKPGVEAPTATSNAITSEATKLIVQLEDERVKLLQDLGNKHPKIEELDARLAQARSRLSPPAVSTAVPEAWSLPYMYACLRELRMERDILSKQLGPKHARVVALDSYIAEVEAKIQEIETADRAERAKTISELKEVITGMTPEWFANLRAKRDQLAKDDPTNPQVHDWDITLPAAIMTQRSYQRMIEAFESGQDSSVDGLTRTLMERMYAPDDLAQQIAQLRKDYDAAEVEAQRLAEQLRQPGSKASKDDLQKTVEQAFKLRQSLLRAELSEMLDRLAKTQHSIDLRDRITDQIVTRRVEELLNPQLEWKESKSGTQPVTPPTSPKESAPTQPQEWTAKLQGHWQLMQQSYEPVDTSDGKKPQPGDVKRENWNPETYYRKQTTPWKAMFDESRMSICKEDGSDPMTFDLTFQKAGPPQQVDLTMELSPADLAELNQMDEENRSSNGIPTFKGILEETPEGFRICLDMGKTGTRPFLFVLGPDTGLWEFRRESVAPTATAQEQVVDEETLPLAEKQPAEKQSASSDTEIAKPAQLTAEQLTLLFLAILERRPTDREEEAWLKSIQNGQSVTDVISTLLANNQVFNRVDRDKSGYIKYLHRLLMDRAPTAEELTYWTRRYDELQGIRSEVAREFLGSVSVDSTASEFLARLAAAPQPPKPEAMEPAAPASQTTPSKMTGDKRNALMATQDIPAGYPLTHLNVQMVEIPASILASVGGDFIQTSEEFESRSLRSSAATGELIRKSNLNEKGIFNASTQIPKGMRINTFPVTVSQAHIGMLKTDDWVDVTVTFTTPKGAVEAKTLLEHVRVFAIEEKTSKGEDGQPVLRSRFVTLLVTPEQDGYIEIAKTKGQLSLSPRNPDDDELVKPNGLNAHVLDELKHAIVPGDSPAANATELEGDWHLLWMDTGEQKMRFAANMSIRGDQCAFSEQKTLRESQISVDEKAKTLSWSNLRYDAPPDEVPLIPAGFQGSYELNGERLTIRSPEGRAVSGWSRGLCDLQATKRTSDEMIRVLLTELITPPSQGQHTPGDKVDVAAEWVLPDGTQKTGRFVELVEVDAVEYDEAVTNGITIICNQETGKLIYEIQARAKLVLIARQPGDEIPQLPEGMNSSVLTEIKAAAGADPVTPLEGDWYLESQEANGDVMGHRTNMTIRGDVWSKEFLIGDHHGDTKKLTGLLRINKQDHSYVISEWPQLGLAQIKGDGARYHVDEKGTFELTDDKLIMKGRELPGNATLTRTWKRGHRRLVPGLSNVSSERKLRWRSGIVEIYQNGLMPDRVDDDEGLNNRVGVGVFMAPDGLIVAQVSRGSEFAAKPDSYPLSAKFDDGSQVNVKVVEDAKNGWMTLKPDKEMRVNYFFPIASTPTAVSDEVYQWGIATKGLRGKFDVSVNRILLVDRNVSNVDVPVMQLSTPIDPIRSLAGLPVSSADGELLAMTMPNTGDLLLALPASRLKSMFPKSFSTASVPPAGPPVEGEKPAAAPVGEEKPAEMQFN